MDDNKMQDMLCDHSWSWISPAGASNSARLCIHCHEPDPEWLNTISENKPCPIFRPKPLGKGHLWAPFKISWLFWHRYKVCLLCKSIERII